MQRPELGPVVFEPLVDRVHLSLRTAILDGSIPPGERLVERDLADRLHVSRAPVRDALRALRHEGLVKAHGRKGLCVNTLSARDAWEVYTIRAALESLAARLACERLTPEALRELRDIVAAMEQASRAHDVQELSSLDVRFHERMCRISGHRRLLATWSGMAAQIRLLSGRVVQTLYADLSDVTARHRSLLAILESRDAARLSAEIEHHIHSVAQRVIGQLDTMERLADVPGTEDDERRPPSAVALA